MPKGDTNVEIGTPADLRTRGNRRMTDPCLDPSRRLQRSGLGSGLGALPRPPFYVGALALAAIGAVGFAPPVVAPVSAQVLAQAAPQRAPQHAEQPANAGGPASRGTGAAAQRQLPPDATTEQARDAP